MTTTINDLYIRWERRMVYASMLVIATVRYCVLLLSLWLAEIQEAYVSPKLVGYDLQFLDTCHTVGQSRLNNCLARLLEFFQGTSPTTREWPIGRRLRPKWPDGEYQQGQQNSRCQQNHQHGRDCQQSW